MKTAASLPKRFTIVFDVLKRGVSHYIGVFAISSAENYLGYSNLPLGIPPKENKASQDAQEHFENLELVPLVFQRIKWNIMDLISDNKAQLVHFLDFLGFFCCQSHFFKLAVKDLLKD